MLMCLERGLWRLLVFPGFMRLGSPVVISEFYTKERLELAPLCLCGGLDEMSPVVSGIGTLGSQLMVLFGKHRGKALLEEMGPWSQALRV